MLKPRLTAFWRHFTASKLPLNRTAADSLPVYQYPARSENCTSVHVWGKSDHGALGIYVQKRNKMANRFDKRFKKFNRPLRMTFAEQHQVHQVAAGYGFSLFHVRNTDGDKLFGTGINNDSQIGVHEPRRDAPLGVLLAPAPINIPTENKKLKIGHLAAGRAHTVIVTESGSVLSMGNNAYGQCGRPVIQNENYSGNKIVHKIINCNGERAKLVECGMDHTLIITENGKVFSCGWGADGQTGLGHYNNCDRLSPVGGDICGENIVKISSKGDCVLALNDKGDVFGWGNSEYSQLFNEGDTRPQINFPVHLKKCSGFGKIVDVAAAGSHCLMLNDKGEVYSWGYGVLGQGPEVQQSWQPRLIPPILFGQNEFRSDAKVVSVSTGLAFSGAITNYGDVYTWGHNRSCSLGLGDSKDQFFPLRVALGQTALKLSLGVDHALCLTKI